VNHGIGSAHERLVWEQDPEVWRRLAPDPPAAARDQCHTPIHPSAPVFVFTEASNTRLLRIVVPTKSRSSCHPDPA
jgi:hypothetical protein